MSKIPVLSRDRSGFTIVELLIVVVIIAVLAVVIIVGYNGITGKAVDSALRSDLTAAARKLNIDKINDRAFPSSSPDYLASTIQYRGSGNTFCATASKDGKSFHVTEAGSVKSGECPQIPPPTTMQAMTPAHCSAMTTYTGSNPAATISLTDSRGGTARTYEVAKLADGNCWMLNNLKLGSTTAITNLTSSDTNLTTKSSFTLPQVAVPTAADYDNPQAVGTVPGDTGSGTANYGYLYSWPAATAGESRTSHIASAGNAPNSICPANWRLPTGAATGEFAILNAKMNNPGATTPSTSGGKGYYQNWHNTGPFKGVFSGNWNSGFKVQGSIAYFWSSSAYPTNANAAHSADLNTSNVGTSSSSFRYLGFGVRCLLN